MIESQFIEVCFETHTCEMSICNGILIVEEEIKVVDCIYTKMNETKKTFLLK